MKILKNILKMILFLIILYIINALFFITLYSTRDEAIYNKLVYTQKKLEDYKHEHGNYPSQIDAFKLICDDSICNDYIYKNLNNTIALYYKGNNGIDEYTFGDDIRVPLRDYGNREDNHTRFIIFNSIVLGIVLGFSLSFLWRKRKERITKKFNK